MRKVVNGVRIEMTQEEIDALEASRAVDPVAELERKRAGMVVSRFQARAALHGAGLLSAVETAVANADPITQLAWADALEFRRNSPTIAALAGIVGLTDEQIDNLFIAAGQIQA